MCFRRLATPLALLLVLSCEEPLVEPPPSGFIAIVVATDGPAGAVAAPLYMRIQELSGTLGINEVIEIEPNDTVIRNYPLATYDVFVDSVPPACTSRLGFGQRAQLSTPGHTSILRFKLECNSLLNIIIFTDGYQLDDAFIWRVVDQNGAELSGVAAPNDTIRLDSIAAGPHTVELGHIAGNCTILGSGARRQTVAIVPPMPQTVFYLLRCSDPLFRPQILQFQSSITGNLSAFYAEVYDPNRDIERYHWTITDCLGNPIDNKLAIFRNQLMAGHTENRDTVRVAATVHLVDPNVDTSRFCTALAFVDREGHATPWREERTGNERGFAPVITRFNAVHADGRISFVVDATDFDHDLGGVFVSVAMKDGTLQGTDGKPDIGIFHPAGYQEPFVLPDLNVTGPIFQLDDILYVALDAIDRAGNLTRVIDSDFAQ